MHAALGLLPPGYERGTSLCPQQDSRFWLNPSGFMPVLQRRFDLVLLVLRPAQHFPAVQTLMSVVLQHGELRRAVKIHLGLLPFLLFVTKRAQVVIQVEKGRSLGF